MTIILTMVRDGGRRWRWHARLLRVCSTLHGQTGTPVKIQTDFKMFSRHDNINMKLGILNKNVDEGKNESEMSEALRLDLAERLDQLQKKAAI